MSGGETRPPALAERMDRLAMDLRFALRSLRKRPRQSVGLAVMLAIIALALSYLPARPAAAIDPMVALRSE